MQSLKSTRLCPQDAVWQIALEPLHDSGKGQPLSCKTPCKRSSTYPQFASDRARSRFAMWQKQSDSVLDTRSEGIQFRCSSRNCLLAIFNQKVVEIRISANYRHLFDRRGKGS
jgi:hypothetical protein